MWCLVLSTPTTALATSIGVFVGVVGILLFGIVVVVVGGSIFRVGGLSLLRVCRQGRKLHHQLKARWHGTTRNLHSLNGGLDLFLLGHASHQRSGRIVVFGACCLFRIVLFAERRIGRDPSLGGLFLGGLLGVGRLAGLPIDLFFDLHGGGFLGLGQSTAGSGGRGSLGASGGDGSIGNRRLFGRPGSRFLGLGFGFAGEGLGLLPSSVGDDIVCIVYIYS